MSRTFATLWLAVALIACGGADRRSESPTPAKSSGGAGPGVTSAPPAEPDTFDVPPATKNPARRPWSEELAELRSNLVSQTGFRQSEPLLGEGGRAGSGGSGFGGVLVGGRGPASGGNFSRGGLSGTGG
jgi:hypothetical protein